MKNNLKRLFALLLVMVMVGSMLPAPHVHAETADTSEPVVLTDADYAAADAVFAQIDAMEEAPAKKNATQTQLADAAEALVMASENYVEGSLERNGDFFTWWTTEGIRCAYSPRMRQIQDDMVAPENPIADGIYNEPVATKGGWPSGNQVYLIGPYYGSDDSFTDQYKNEAKAIANAIGDTDGYTLYSGTAATVDKVADAVENGAVVIFDSHGTTDYDGSYVCDDPDGYEVYDYVSKAENSYLCLETSSGMTNADYQDGALYGSGYAYINGATIANHMESNSPGGLLWMAICLGMATDTLCEPLRDMGVEVVYGYSQSVTFAGDYLYEETFWDNLCVGKDVATSIAAMKTKWGNWDWSDQIAKYYGYSGYSAIADARKYRSAFPVVVSDEDTHPGQRGVDSTYGACSLQTVKSTYTLFSQYEVTATTNNSAYGSVSVSGSTITATPATGYFAESATVIGGTATVTQNGNTFSVMAESDCTVQINFAAKTAVTVSFSGATVAAQTGYAGDAMQLPTADAPEGFDFLGWTTSALSQDTTEKPDFYTDYFIPTASTTLYALYSYVDENSGTGTGDYVKVTSTPADWSGEYLIVYEADGYIFNGSLTALDATSNYKAVTITNNTIAADAGDPYKFTIAAVDGGYSILGAGGKYIGHGSNANGLTPSDTALSNTISLDASGNANIIGSGGAYLRYNSTSGQYRFRYYKSSTYSSQKPIALYLKDGSAGTTCYTSNPTNCEHTNTQTVAAVAATCTQSGYTEGIQCADCGALISGHEVVNALGHSWGDWTQSKAPTCTEAGQQSRSCATCGKTETQSIAATGHSYDNGVITTTPGCEAEGVKTYTCENCGSTYTEVVAATGHNYVLNGTTYTCSNCGDSYDTFVISFSVPGGVTAVSSIPYTDGGITLPGADAPEGYAFVGWSATTVDNATEAPTIYGEGDTYTATAAITLYALYTYEVAGEGSSEYVLTDIANISASDLVVVTMTYGSTVYALSSANGTSSAPAAPAVTVADNKLSTEPAAELIWNIGGDSSGYIFYPNGTTATWLYCTGTNNGVRVGTNSSKTFTIDASSGYLKHSGTSRYLGVYRTNPDWRCYTSATVNIKDQTLGFYVKGEGSTVYYTTVIDGDVCIHQWNAGEVTTAAGCETEGVMTYTCTLCGESKTEAIPASGHNYVDGTCDVCGATELDNRFYIATIRSSGNYFYMTSDLGTGSTERYQAVDSGLTALPEQITEPEAGYVFVLEENADGTYCIYAEGVDGDNYLGWNSGNSGALVAKESALKLTVEEVEGGYNIHFTASDAERYLSLNGTTGNDYFAWYKTGQKNTLTLIPVANTEPVNPVTFWNVSLGDAIGLNFVINLDEGDEVGFFNGDTELSYTVADGNYSIVLAAAQMTDQITIKINGKALENTYSVRGYADIVLANESLSDCHQLVRAMLHYGAASQSYFSYNTGNLANAGIAADTYTVPETGTGPTVTGSAPGIQLYGASLLHQDRIAVRFYFTVEEGYILQGDGIGTKDGLTYFEIAGINPHELNAVITVAVGELSVSYSPMDYIVRMYNKSTNANTKALVQALYGYYVAAAAYTA